MAKQELHQALQSTLRENPPAFQYHNLARKNGCYRSLLIIGMRQYQGTSVLSQDWAERTATSKAYAELFGMAEEALRDTLGLRHRKHLTELDHVRDCLRQLKRRYRYNVDREDSVAAYRHIGKLYQALDLAEMNLINDLGFFD